MHSKIIRGLQYKKGVHFVRVDMSYLCKYQVRGLHVCNSLLTNGHAKGI